MKVLCDLLTLWFEVSNLCPLLLPFIINAQKLSLLEESLCKVETSDPTAVSAIIDKYSEQPSLKEDSVYHRLVCNIYIQHTNTHI